MKPLSVHARVNIWFHISIGQRSIVKVGRESLCGLIELLSCVKLGAGTEPSTVFEPISGFKLLIRTSIIERRGAERRRGAELRPGKMPLSSCLKAEEGDRESLRQ